MDIDNIDDDCTIKKIDRALSKMTTSIAVPMLVITVLSTVIDFAEGNPVWGTIMLLCSAWWAFVVYLRCIDKHS